MKTRPHLTTARAPGRPSSSEDAFATLLGAASDPIIVTALDSGEILRVNDAFVGMCGWQRDELIGRRSADIGWWSDIAARDALVAQIARGGSAGPIESCFRRRDGAERVGQLSAHVVEIEGRQCLLAIARDVTERVEQQRAIADRESLYRLLAEHSLDIISRHAPDGTTLYVSPACKTLLGYEPEELIGRNGLDLIHPDDVAQLTAIPPDPASPLRLTYRSIRKDGSLLWMEAVVRTALDPETGALREVTATARDITERVQQEEVLRRQTELYEALLGAQSDLGQGFLIAEAGRLVYANDAYTRITGYTHEELLGLRSLLDLATPSERDLIADRMMRRARGEDVPDHYETSMIRKDGSHVDLEVAIKSITFNGVPQMVTIVRDITERKRHEAVLRESERRFAELYERERETAVRLRALDEMKNDFLSAVSHELRTPLTGILGFAQTLEANASRLTPDQQEDFIHRIVNNGHKLERLLSDLLDLDRAKRGIIDAQRRPVDVAALVRRTTEEWLATTDRRVTVEGADVMAAIDPGKVERIVENLLSNAAKHTPAASPIWIVVEQMGDGVRICVDDAGPGVPDQMKASVFEPFMRGADTPKHAPGTGIGLSLVRRFAELHGGRAWVQDRAGGGASFRVFLPGTIVSSPPRSRATA